MARKVIIDCDPGVDDAVALCMAFADPRLEVLAVTAVEGNTSAEQINQNLQGVIEQLDPPRRPRVGTATPLENGSGIDACHIHGADGLANAPLVCPQLHQRHPSEKIIADVVRSNPEQVTIIALGPLTNVAKAFRLDPELPQMVGGLVMMGGSVSGVGNVTPAAEFNIFYDPQSARQVFRAPVTKTLVPLDVTREVCFRLEFIEQLPTEKTRAGKLLRAIVPHIFRTYRQELGIEGVHLHDAIALALVVHPELFTMTEMVGDVEVSGEITTGATIFDRRQNPRIGASMDVAVGVDAVAVTDCVVRCLTEAGRTL
jgi:inosine-uridine nucleoside N-ribohydrolase